MKEQPGSAAVVNGVANDRGGIGYSGIGYKTSEVRAVPLAKSGQGPARRADLRQRPERQAIRWGGCLYIYVAKKPGEPLSPLVKEFLKFVLSKEGQEIVVKDGYGPLPATRSKRNRLKIVE